MPSDYTTQIVAASVQSRDLKGLRWNLYPCRRMQPNQLDQVEFAIRLRFITATVSDWSSKHPSFIFSVYLSLYWYKRILPEACYDTILLPIGKIANVFFNCWSVVCYRSKAYACVICLHSFGVNYKVPQNNGDKTLIFVISN